MQSNAIAHQMTPHYRGFIMYGTLIGISALLLGVFAMNLGFGLQATLLGVRAGIEGFPITLTGIIMATYYGGYVLGSIYSPKFVAKVGHIRVFAALASIASTAALLHAVFLYPVTWIVLRVITGFCLAGLLIVAESWLNHASTNHNRGSTLSIYMVVSLGASALGQLLLNAAPVVDMHLFILVSVLVSISLVPIVLTTRSVPPLQPTPRMAIRKLFTISPMGTVGCFATGMITGAFWGIAAVYAAEIGLNVKDISIFMSIIVLGGIFSQWPLGRLSDRIDRRLVIAGLAAAITVASLGLAMAGTLDMQAIMILGFAFGAAAFPLYAIAIAHVNDTLSIDDFVPASSALLLVYALGALFGPFMGATAMDIFGPAGLFFYMAAVSVALGAFALKRLYFGKTVKSKDKDDFISVPRTSAQAYEMASQVVEEAAALDDETDQGT